MKQIDTNATVEIQGDGSVNMHSGVNKSFATKSTQSNDFIKDKHKGGAVSDSRSHLVSNVEKQPAKRTTSCPLGRAHSV